MVKVKDNRTDEEYFIHEDLWLSLDIFQNLFDGDHNTKIVQDYMRKRVFNLCEKTHPFIKWNRYSKEEKEEFMSKYERTLSEWDENKDNYVFMNTITEFLVYNSDLITSESSPQRKYILMGVKTLEKIN